MEGLKKCGNSLKGDGSNPFQTIFLVSKVVFKMHFMLFEANFDLVFMHLRGPFIFFHTLGGFNGSVEISTSFNPSLTEFLGITQHKILR